MAPDAVEMAEGFSDTSQMPKANWCPGPRKSRWAPRAGWAFAAAAYALWLGLCLVYIFEPHRFPFVAVSRLPVFPLAAGDSEAGALAAPREPESFPQTSASFRLRRLEKPDSTGDFSSEEIAKREHYFVGIMAGASAMLFLLAAHVSWVKTRAFQIDLGHLLPLRSLLCPTWACQFEIVSKPSIDRAYEDVPGGIPPDWDHRHGYGKSFGTLQAATAFAASFEDCVGFTYVQRPGEDDVTVFLKSGGTPDPNFVAGDNSLVRTRLFTGTRTSHLKTFCGCCGPKAPICGTDPESQNKPESTLVSVEVDMDHCVVVDMPHWLQQRDLVVYLGPSGFACGRGPPIQGLEVGQMYYTLPETPKKFKLLQCYGDANELYLRISAAPGRGHRFAKKEKAAFLPRSLEDKVETGLRCHNPRFVSNRRTLIIIVFGIYATACVVVPVSQWGTVSCKGGIFWEAHMVFFAVFVFTKFTEIFIYRCDPTIVRHPISWMFLEKFVSSFPSFADAYTDATSIHIGYACSVEADNVQMLRITDCMLISFVIGVVILQFLILPSLAMEDPSHVMLLKLVHMDALSMCTAFPREFQRRWNLLAMARTFGEDVLQCIFQALLIVVGGKNYFLMLSVAFSLCTAFKALWDAINRKLVDARTEESLSCQTVVTHVNVPHYSHSYKDFWVAVKPSGEPYLGPNGFPFLADKVDDGQRLTWKPRMHTDGQPVYAPPGPQMPALDQKPLPDAATASEVYMRRQEYEEKLDQWLNDQFKRLKGEYLQRIQQVPASQKEQLDSEYMQQRVDLQLAIAQERKQYYTKKYQAEELPWTYGMQRKLFEEHPDVYLAIYGTAGEQALHDEGDEAALTAPIFSEAQMERARGSTIWTQMPPQQAPEDPYQIYLEEAMVSVSRFFGAMSVHDLPPDIREMVESDAFKRQQLNAFHLADNPNPAERTGKISKTQLAQAIRLSADLPGPHTIRSPETGSVFSGLFKDEKGYTFALGLSSPHNFLASESPDMEVIPEPPPTSRSVDENRPILQEDCLQPASPVWAPGQEHHIDALIRRFDRDQDGCLQPDEFVEFSKLLVVVNYDMTVSTVSSDPEVSSNVLDVRHECCSTSSMCCLGWGIQRVYFAPVPLSRPVSQVIEQVVEVPQEVHLGVCYRYYAGHERGDGAVEVKEVGHTNAHSGRFEFGPLTYYAANASLPPGPLCRAVTGALPVRPNA